MVNETREEEEEEEDDDDDEAEEEEEEEEEDEEEEEEEEEEDIFRLLRKRLEVVGKYLLQVVVWVRAQWSHNTRHWWANTNINANHAR